VDGYEYYIFVLDILVSLLLLWCAMAQKLFSTGPGIFRMAERNKTIDGLDRTSCGSLFQSEMVSLKL